RCALPRCAGNRWETARSAIEAWTGTCAGLLNSMPLRAHRGSSVDGSRRILVAVTRRAPILLAVLLLAAGAQGSVVRALSIDDLARRAALVGLGSVLSVEVHWSANHRHLYRQVVILREEAWKGAPPTHITLVVPGGEKDGVGEKVVGEPNLVQ